MNDVGIIALAESTVRYVDENWGRSVAWVLAMATIVAPIAIAAFILF